MPRFRLNIAVLTSALAFLTGCVDRRFVVTTNVPGAQITVDGTALGPAPVDDRYDYTGWREFRAVAPGYQPLVKRVKFEPKWYDYPVIDLIAEVFWPFRIEDTRRVDLQLEPLQPLRQEELNMRAEELRARRDSLPPSSVPDQQTEPAVPEPRAPIFPRLISR